MDYAHDRRKGDHLRIKIHGKKLVFLVTCELSPWDGGCPKGSRKEMDQLAFHCCRWVKKNEHHGVSEFGGVKSERDIGTIRDCTMKLCCKEFGASEVLQ